MHAPDFWQPGKGGLCAALLSPLGYLYGLATRTKLATTTAWKSPVPILCVGNLIAGGAGKTPVAIDLGQRLTAKGKAVHFLSRGYGGTEKGPLRVDAKAHDYHSVGDEPLLLSHHAPTWVSRERKQGGITAAEAGADLIIMDDGFQNPYIHKNFSLIVVDGSFGFGNSRLIPAGPLRERVADGLARADAVVVIGEDRTNILETVAKYGHTALQARLVPSPLPEDIQGQAVIPFAGIGRPEKFFQTVAGLDCRIVSPIAFADHHPYNDTDMAHLLDTAKKSGAQLLTTEKDACRLPTSFLENVTVLGVSLEWNEKEALESLLDSIGDV